MSWAKEPAFIYALTLLRRDSPAAVVEDFLQVLPRKLQFLMSAVDFVNASGAPNA